jgi:hypothetical protein
LQRRRVWSVQVVDADYGRGGGYGGFGAVLCDGGESGGTQVC